MAHRTWGGRFGEGPDALAARFNASLAFDRALWREDLWQNRVHARMLHAVGLLSAEELEASKATLENLYNSFRNDPMMATDARDLEKMIANITLRIEGLNN